MCGIFAAKTTDSEKAVMSLMRLKHRGPDGTCVVIKPEYVLGFHRLAVMDTSDAGMQPFYSHGVTVLYNGEIYEVDNKKWTDTRFDGHALAYAYSKYGTDLVKHITGVYAFVIIDGDRWIIGRDTFGVRPLFFDGTSVASEAKGLMYPDACIQFPPGEVWVWDDQIKTIVTRQLEPIHDTRGLYDLLDHAVRIRCDTDRPIGCLLSGGLDSSIIAYLVKKYVPKLHTYSIGFKGSTDLEAAARVAEYLGTIHHQIEMPETSVSDVIWAIESSDRTTVRASIGMYYLSKYISENNTPIIFSGEGADEMGQGYVYFKNAPNPQEALFECYRLLNNIHYFDGLRADRTTAAHGLELRVPFLDKTVVEHYLSLDSKPDKYYLREAFRGILPDWIIDRPKETFSDGVHPPGQKWTDTDYVAELKSLGLPKHVPYEWMPKWVDANDPSARSYIF